MKTKVQPPAQAPRPVLVRAYHRVRYGRNEFVRRYIRRPQTQLILPFEQIGVDKEATDAKE